jgi:predicted metal-binding protein
MKHPSAGKGSSREILEDLFEKHGHRDFRWIDPRRIVVSQWVRMKCMFGCKEFGKGGCCPPNTPSVSECQAFFRGYRKAVVFHFGKRFKKPEDRHAWTRKVNLKLLKLEREIFLAGNYKTFLLFMDSCDLCSSCPGVREKCKQPMSSRPTPESMAMDVFETVRKIGYPIEVLSDYSQEMNRYAFLFIE